MNKAVAYGVENSVLAELLNKTKLRLAADDDHDEKLTFMLSKELPNSEHPAFIIGDYMDPFDLVALSEAAGGVLILAHNKDEKDYMGAIDGELYPHVIAVD